MEISKSFYYEGKVKYNDNIKLLTYQATTKIKCGRCNQDIESDELFSRSADKKGTVVGIRYTFCRKCIPFEVIEKPIDYKSYFQN